MSFKSVPAVKKKEFLEILDNINLTLGEWNIIRLINNIETSDLKKIYFYVHDKLGMYGEEGDEDKYNLDHEKWSEYNFYLQLIRIPYKNKLDLIRLLQIAYNLGQLSCYLNDTDVYNEEAIKYYDINKLGNINSYIKLVDNNILYQQINNYIDEIISNDSDSNNTAESFNDTNSNTNSESVIYFLGGSKKKKPFYYNIEKSTDNNNNYRKVLYTSKNQQFVLMSLKPKEDIHMEVHKDHDQFIVVIKGTGIAIIEGKIYKLKDGIGLIIPAGSRHQIINNGKNKLKLYTIYSPPEHPDGLIQKLKSSQDKNFEKKYIKYKNKYLNYKN